MSTTNGHNELSALIRLLDEPDNTVFDKIRNKIYSYGSQAIPSLEDAWENSFDNIIQQRIENIIHSLQMDDVYRELHTWANTGATDLLKGHLLITKHQYPDLDESNIREQINKIKQDVWLEINNNLTSLEKIKVLNHIMFDVHGFTSNKANIHAPQNSYINTLLESKKGNPLSLGILYITLARDLDIPVFGVNLPQHFILAYANEVIEKDQRVIDEHDILFYINPFNKGAVFTRREIDLFIKQLNINPDKSHILPCSNVTIIKRLIENLKYAYDKIGYPDKINMLKWLEEALS